jgi:regulator of sigma E protease
MEAGPAYEAGLQENDKIISLNGEKIYLFEEMALFNRINGGQEVTVEFERNGTVMETKLTPAYDAESGSYILGVYCNAIAEEKGLTRMKYAWYELRFCVQQTYKSLGLLVKGQVQRDEVAGPVGIAVNVVGKTYDQAKEYGALTVFVNMLNIVMVLSMNLGILNLLPIPALDGGRILFLLWEGVTRKPVPQKYEAVVHTVGFVLLILLIVVVTFSDIRKLF